MKVEDARVPAFDEMQHVRGITDALVHAATELMRCRSEQEALELVGDRLHALGFAVTVMIREGDLLLHSVLRHEESALRASEALYGRPMTEVKIPLEAMPQTERVFGEGRVNFTESVLSVVAKIHPPEVVEVIKPAFPFARSVEAPIPVEGRIHGMLVIFADDLTPACASVLELFGRMLGAALENVRHHQRAEEQVERLKKLQSELLAQERLAMLGEASGAMAHEIRNPLGVILNGVAILRQETGMRSARSALALDMVEEELTRLEALVKDLLHAARPFKLERQGCDLAAWARSSVPLSWKQLAQHASLRLRLEVPDASPELPADEHLLQLAIEKLLKNAAQGSPSSGLVRFSIEERKGAVVLVVEDEGAGVDLTHEERFFRPFVAARGLSSGLGMAVVERVAQAHGGTARAFRLEPKGLRVEVVVPRT